MLPDPDQKSTFFLRDSAIVHNTVFEKLASGRASSRVPARRK